MATLRVPAPRPSDDTQQYYLPVKSHVIRSRFVEQAFRIQVMQPVCVHGETTKFPVVYVTDGNLTFDMFKGFSYLIQSPLRPHSRFILVSIGYPGDHPYTGAILRGRDFTFPGYPQLKLKSDIEGVLKAEEGAKDFYGAGEFQQFIEHELVPLIDDRYPTQSAARTYFGHSGGGGFGLYTLFNHPQLFDNYIISSPGLIFHGESSAGVHYEEYDFVLQEARKFIASKRALTGKKLYMSVGTEEEFEAGLGEWRMTSSFYRMAGLLKAAKISGLEFTMETFNGENHMTAWPLSFMHGIQVVMGLSNRYGVRA